MKLNKQEIEHIAHLARLSLNDKESKVYGEQISDILSYIGLLNEVDTTDIEPTAQVTGLKNVFREDRVEACPEINREQALEQAPELESGQIKVRRVLK